MLSRNNKVVAIKVVKLREHGARKSFMAECEALRHIRHRNLAKIITSCSSIDFRGNDFGALVFEFMPNGSLDKWLHPTGECVMLNIVQRLHIAIDVAVALDYLHHQCHVQIVHCDLKPSNVLLDDDMHALVSDFGLAKFLMARASQAESSSIGLRGTIGYVAPEYGLTREVSTQGDVYSYGILLLELFTGKRPTESMFASNFKLHDFVEMALPDRPMKVIDPSLNLEEEGNSDNNGQCVNTGNIRTCLAMILQVGVVCSAASPRERMDIGDVITELYKAKSILLETRLS
ncbi:probable LRR receptor-like serine/threonine-protein kinase At3g47570 [Syzygium oleosum]|uniref:probable LRR receptor-like serine/threonine-protein kinase At3g47570 n=1 Tax=Syzygium oleosum TaxID=219896 RepID=UPI0011D1EB95|nr:probable LRR receptor-like serine/threonine-protein kinase At3g47570 [Syzygium oleosum]